MCCTINLIGPLATQLAQWALVTAQAECGGQVKNGDTPFAGWLISGAIYFN